MKCRFVTEKRNLDLCFLQADSLLLLSVAVGLFQREGEDVEVVAQLVDLEKKHKTNSKGTSFTSYSIQVRNNPIQKHNSPASIVEQQSHNASLFWRRYGGTSAESCNKWLRTYCMLYALAPKNTTCHCVASNLAIFVVHREGVHLATVERLALTTALYRLFLLPIVKASAKCPKCKF